KNTLRNCAFAHVRPAPIANRSLISDRELMPFPATAGAFSSSPRRCRPSLAAWAKTEDTKNKLCITLLDCAFPESLSDRAVEVCEPLFKIALAAGGDWYQRVRDAASFIFGAEDDQNQVTLQLAAIRDAFQDDDRLST